MADLKKQKDKTDKIEPEIQEMLDQMALRTYWQKMSVEKQQAMIEADQDPLLTLAWNTYQALNNYFEAI